jgi:putative Mn2+ efflux pump MntP
LANEKLEDTVMPRNDLSLRTDRLVQLGIVLEIIGPVLMALGTPPTGFAETYVPASTPYIAGMVFLLMGVFVLLIGLARYVSRRMSDSDTWWVIKVGPTARPN